MKVETAADGNGSGARAAAGGVPPASMGATIRSDSQIRDDSIQTGWPVDTGPVAVVPAQDPTRSRLWIPLLALVSFAVLFVGAEVIERHLFPEMSTGLRHLLLTLRAAIVTVAVSSLVFMMMRRQQVRMANAAAELARLLESNQSMRAQMVERQKMAAIGQIAAGFAHEVCNPLSSISSVVQMLKRGKHHAHDSEQLDVIERDIQRISTVVRQLSKLAHAEFERMELVHLESIMDQAVQLIAFDAESRDVRIEVELARDLPPIYGLPGQLQQVFINLGLNALDAMPGGGTLTFAAVAGNRHIVLQVKDTGRGIASNIGRRVFEPFFTTKEPGRGTGLGLAVTYDIVQKHGGSIDFTSRPGAGTVFTIELPIRIQAEDTRDAPDQSVAGGR